MHDTVDLSYEIFTQAISDHLKSMTAPKISELEASYTQSWRTYHNLDQIAWMIDTANRHFEEGHIMISDERFRALIVGLLFSHTFWKNNLPGRKPGWREEENAKRGRLAMERFGDEDFAKLVYQMIRAKEKFVIISDCDSVLEDTQTIGWYLDLNLLYATGTTPRETSNRTIAWRDELGSILRYDEFVEVRTKWANQQLARGKRIFSQDFNEHTHGDYVRRVLHAAKNGEMLPEKIAEVA